jgi:hypothetical protein
MSLVHRYRKLAAALLSTLASTFGALWVQAADDGIPHFRTQGTAKQMVVNGKPFLMLGAEWSNSASASAELAHNTWARLASQNVNTSLLAVTWELIEPEEGKFDFDAVDGLIKDAQANNMHIVFLWFASWKNGLSSYPPLWVKTDPKRFPWVKTRRGQSKDILSTLGGHSAQADGKAFAALMKHIREFDDNHTVLMMQVENEVGVREQSRDYSPAANEAFNGPVPKELMDYLASHKGKLAPKLAQRLAAAGNKTAGTWTEVFGTGTATDETFQAWHYARYIETVASMGKKEYPIPMYVNCWLDQGGNPGDWPSGGPVAYLLDIWQAGAPSIDAIAPDLYAGNFEQRVVNYHRSGNPLFIPEANTGACAGSNAIFAFGKHDAICFSPFAVDRGGLGNPEAYLALANLAPAILDNQGKGTIFGWMLGSPAIDSHRALESATVGNYKITVKDNGNGNGNGRNASATGMIITINPDEFYILHSMSTITFAPADPAKGKLNVDLVEEGKFVEDQWIGRAIAVQNQELTRAIAAPFRDYHVKLSIRP